MRKNIVALLILLMFGITYAHAQHFNDYFVDKTLRINYLHIGNKNVEQLQIDHFTLVNHWNGTRSQLLEPYHYGDILIEVLDDASQKLIYSRSYSCLFTEYRTTERGETEIARMEECVNMPMPKNPVRLRLTSFDGAECQEGVCRHEPAQGQFAQKGHRHSLYPRWLRQK